MKNETKLLSLITIAILIGSVSTLYFLKPTSNHKHNSHSYRLFTVKRQSDFSVSGSVSTKETQYLSQPAGQVQSINFKDGSVVQKGDVLITTFTDKSKDINSENQNIDKLNRDYQAKKIDYENLNNQLSSQNENSGDNTDLKSQILTSKNELQDFQDNIANSNSERDNLISSQYTQLVAPFNGYISTEKTNDGSIKLKLSSTELEGIGSISEFDYSKIKVGQSVKIESVASHQTQNTNVTFISASPSTNSKKNMAKYEFKADLDNQKFMDGQTIKISTNQPGFKVPKKSIVDNKFVYKYVKNHAKKVPVTVSETESNYAIITSGISNGDKIILNFKR